MATGFAARKLEIIQLHGTTRGQNQLSERVSLQYYEYVSLPLAVSLAIHITVYDPRWYK